MKLGQLAKGFEIRGNRETILTGLSSDSRVVVPGHLFFARKGEYIASAIAHGASAIVTDLYDPFLSIPQVICQEVRKAEAQMASLYYGYPSKKLFVVGVTGTKGKTTTSYLIQHLLGEACGLMSTIEILIGKEKRDSILTTHGAIFNQKILREMVDRACKEVVVEVSSHAIDQGRVEEIAFDLKVFTNFSPDHLDYHQTIEKYAEAKQQFFLSEEAIVNLDSPWIPKCPRFSIAIQQEADLRAEQISESEGGTEFFVKGVRFVSPLMGLFNVYNALSAIAVGLHRGKSLEELSFLLSSFSGPPGRLERVENKRGIHLFVDFAHTGDSLASALSTLKKIAKQRLIVVFGCGGDRDRGRRKTMAEAASRVADFSIVTSDNPRGEDPEEICREVLKGFSSSDRVVIESDRKVAIARAIREANPGDIILIAGKGHEKMQIFAHRTLPFDDVAVAKEALR